MPVNEEFKPTIVAFCCNWCSYAGADLSGTNRLQYPANVKITFPEEKRNLIYIMLESMETSYKAHIEQINKQLAVLDAHIRECVEDAIVKLNAHVEEKIAEITEMINAINNID